jgi:hypothetical protein
MSSFVDFKTKDEAQIEYVTSVVYVTSVSKKIKYDIYKKKINNCDQYFQIDESYKYIGYIENDMFFVVSLKNDSFDSEFINEFTEKFPSLNKEKNRFIKNVNYKKYNLIHVYFSEKCNDVIDLDNANKKLDILNNELNCINYKINLNYIFQYKKDTELNALGYDFENQLLCIFEGNVCVSSIFIKYDSDEKIIQFDSKTKEEYEGNKLNKLLRAIIIIISKDLYPDADYVISHAINPISAYLMIHYFKAIPVDENNNIIEINFDTYAVIDDYIKKYDGIICKVELNDSNIQHARDVFDDTCKQIKCDKKTVFYMRGHENLGGAKKSHHRKPIPKRKFKRTLKKHKKTKSKK